jgi:UDPglucose 6-dehydrogenase
VTVYEPVLKEHAFFNSRVVDDLAQFKLEADLIVAKRINAALQNLANKNFSRELFFRNWKEQTS